MLNRQGSCNFQGNYTINFYSDDVLLHDSDRYEFEVGDPVEVHRRGVKFYRSIVESKNLGRPGTDPTYDIRYDWRFRYRV